MRSLLTEADNLLQNFQPGVAARRSRRSGMVCRVSQYGKPPVATSLARGGAMRYCKAAGGIGRQCVGRSSAMRLLGCVGNRFKTSRR